MHNKAVKTIKFKVHTLDIKRPCTPNGSWLIASTSLFSNSSLNSGLIVRKSVDIINGDAKTAQTAICALL